MDTILFGDNQFFAINHLSEEKARSQALRFKELDAVIRVLDDVYDMGIRTFMCTTHDRISELCDHFRAHPERYDGFKFFPCMPYAHKYANAVTELGPVGAAMKFMPRNIASAMLTGGTALAKRDFIGMSKLLVDAEMKMFRGLETPVIFLQNVVTDLILGTGVTDAFVVFSDYVRSKYNAEAGFITMNLPMLLDALTAAGLENPIICSSINKIGFRMCGGIELYEKTLREKRCRAIAMQVLAAGAIPPKEAIDYVCGLEGVDSVLFGASTPAHIRQTTEYIRDYFPA